MKTTDSKKETTPKEEVKKGVTKTKIKCRIRTNRIV